MIQIIILIFLLFCYIATRQENSNRSKLNKTDGVTNKHDTIHSNLRNKKLKNAIIDASQKRKKYRFSFYTILYSIFWFPKFKSKCRRKSRKLQNYKTLISGENKMNDELDIRHIVESIRRVKFSSI